jgi:hypothetical protein
MKYLLIQVREYKKYSEEYWFKACVKHPSKKYMFFVPEELEHLLSTPAVDSNHDIVYESEMPSRHFVVIDGDLEGSRVIFINWIAQTVSNRHNVDMESIIETASEFLKIINPTESFIRPSVPRLYNSWHNVYIQSGDLIELDLENDVMYVNHLPCRRNG